MLPVKFIMNNLNANHCLSFNKKNNKTMYSLNVCDGPSLMVKQSMSETYGKQRESKLIKINLLIRILMSLDAKKIYFKIFKIILRVKQVVTNRDHIKNIPFC